MSPQMEFHSQHTQSWWLEIPATADLFCLPSSGLDGTNCGTPVRFSPIAPAPSTRIDRAMDYLSDRYDGLMRRLAD